MECVFKYALITTSIWAFPLPWQLCMHSKLHNTLLSAHYTHSSHIDYTWRQCNIQQDMCSKYFLLIYDEFITYLHGRGKTLWSVKLTLYAFLSFAPTTILTNFLSYIICLSNLRRNITQNCSYFILMPN